MSTESTTVKPFKPDKVSKGKMLSYGMAPFLGNLLNACARWFVINSEPTSTITSGNSNPFAWSQNEITLIPLPDDQLKRLAELVGDVKFNRKVRKRTEEYIHSQVGWTIMNTSNFLSACEMQVY